MRTQPLGLHYVGVANDILRGLLLGAVLWSDKYFLFLKAGDRFAVTSVYLALLPAVLAYNYYFVRLAPRFDASILALRRAMEEAHYHVLVTAYAAIGHPHSLALVAAVAVSSWLAMMITLLCYQLDYIGQSGVAEWFSAVYLVGCAATFVFFPLGAAPYVGLIALDVLLFVLTLRITLSHWRSPEFSLFWRHATAW